MSDNINPEQPKCEPCRTINLAKHIKQPKPDMQLYEKCSHSEKICPQVYSVQQHPLDQRIGELMPITLFTSFRGEDPWDKWDIIYYAPIQPTCIKVCTSDDELKLKKGGKKLALPKLTSNYGHGKIMYAVKAGILVSAVYFTYAQGVWGDQQDATECIRRWQEYIRSLNTRRPPVFDHCGNVIRQESSESLIAPLYNMYKNLVTTCFSGVVKIPLLIKCAYIDYKKALERKEEELAKERKLKKLS